VVGYQFDNNPGGVQEEDSPLLEEEKESDDVIMMTVCCPFQKFIQKQIERGSVNLLLEGRGRGGGLNKPIRRRQKWSRGSMNLLEGDGRGG
jgi:hypothetical protein